MDNIEIFRNYCTDQGLTVEDFEPGQPIELTLDMGGTFSVLVSEQAVHLEASLGELGAFSDEFLRAALRAPLMSSDGPLRACPVRFYVSGQSESLLVEGAREMLEDEEDLKAMLSAFVSIKVYFASLAKA